jgi:hypothetical protein
LTGLPSNSSQILEKIAANFQHIYARRIQKAFRRYLVKKRGVASSDLVVMQDKSLSRDVILFLNASLPSIAGVTAFVCLGVPNYNCCYQGERGIQEGFRYLEASQGCV